MKKTQPKQFLFGITAGVVTFGVMLGGFSVALAVWRAPVVAPPGENVDPFSIDLLDILLVDADAGTFTGDVNIGKAGVETGSSLYIDGGEVSGKWLHATGEEDNSIFGNLKIGSGVPEQKVDVDGAVRIANSESTRAGTIRWTGTDFEGYTGTEWVSLTLVNGVIYGI